MLLSNEVGLCHMPNVDWMVWSAKKIVTNSIIKTHFMLFMLAQRSV